MLTDSELLTRLIKLLMNFDGDGKEIAELYKDLTSATPDFVKSRLCVSSWQAKQGYDMTALTMITEAAYYTATQSLGLYNCEFIQAYFESFCSQGEANNLIGTYEAWVSFSTLKTLSEAVDHYKQTMGHKL